MALVFNRLGLQSQTSLSCEKVLNIAKVFADTFPLKLKELELVMHNMDDEGLRRFLHALKGSACMCGADRIFERVVDFEKTPASWWEVYKFKQVLQEEFEHYFEILGQELLYHNSPKKASMNSQRHL